MVSTYDVINSGELYLGYEAQYVHAAFAELFNISQEQAEQFLQQKQVIKSGLDFDNAQRYKQRLENIGIIIEINENKPQFSLQSAHQATLAVDDDEEQGDLACALATPTKIKAESIASMNRSITSQAYEKNIDYSSDQATASYLRPAHDSEQKGKIECPKCGAFQHDPKQCQQCGVYFHKLQANGEQSSHQYAALYDHRSSSNSAQTHKLQSKKPVETANLTLFAIMSIIVAAVICCVAWVGISKQLQIDYAFIPFFCSLIISLVSISIAKKTKALFVFSHVVIAASLFYGLQTITVNSLEEDMKEFKAQFFSEEKRLVQAINIMLTQYQQNKSEFKEMFMSVTEQQQALDETKKPPLKKMNLL